MNSKKTIILAFSLLLLTNVAAQEKSISEIVKTQAARIIELSKNLDYDNAGKLMAKEVQNGETQNILPVETKNPGDMILVKRICKNINALQKISSSFSLNEIVAEKFDGNDIITLLVNFASGNQEISKKFRFVKVGNDYLLYRID